MRYVFFNTNVLLANTTNSRKRRRRDMDEDESPPKDSSPADTQDTNEENKENTQDASVIVRPRARKRQRPNYNKAHAEAVMQTISKMMTETRTDEIQKTDLKKEVGRSDEMEIGEREFDDILENLSNLNRIFLVGDGTIMKM